MSTYPYSTFQPPVNTTRTGVYNSQNTTSPWTTTVVAGTPNTPSGITPSASFNAIISASELQAAQRKNLLRKAADATAYLTTGFVAGRAAVNRLIKPAIKAISRKPF